MLLKLFEPGIARPTCGGVGFLPKLLVEVLRDFKVMM